MRKILWNIYISVLLLVKNKLKGKKTEEKRILEIVVHLAKAHQVLDSIRVNDDCEPVQVRSFNQIFQECLDKYDRAAAKYGEFDPITDKRDLIVEAQQKLIDAMNYLTMFNHQVRERKMNDETEDHLSYDTEKWIKENSEDSHQQSPEANAA